MQGVVQTQMTKLKWEQTNIRLLVKGFAPIVPPEKQLTVRKKAAFGQQRFKQWRDRL